MKKLLQLVGYFTGRRSFFSCIVGLSVCTGLNAQLVVPTTPQKKNFLIERGSGIACCSCPGVTDKCMNVIDSYPKGKGIFMVYHFGPDAKPQSGQLNKDYRTRFGDSICTPTWPFYLNMMINRKDRGNPYGSTFIFGSTDQVTPECASVAAETAPVNLGMSSVYNPATREIIVDVKAYYTSNSATTDNYLHIAITEDSIVGPQCGANGASGFVYNYVHMDMFRANITGNEGDKITTTTAGTTVTRTYKYIVPAKYGTGPATGQVTPSISHFKLTLFVTESKNPTTNQKLFGKIQNVIRVPLGASSTPTGIADIRAGEDVNIYPNPSTGVCYMETSTLAPYSYQVLDLMGNIICPAKNLNGPVTRLELSGLQKGIYIVKITSEKGISMHKVMLMN